MQKNLFVVHVFIYQYLAMNIAELLCVLGGVCFSIRQMGYFVKQMVVPQGFLAYFAVSHSRHNLFDLLSNMIFLGYFSVTELTSNYVLRFVPIFLSC